jgi:hypothetical protein
MAVTLLGTVIADGDAWGQNIHLYERTTDPSSTSVGDWWYRSDTDKFKAVTSSQGTVTIPAIDPTNAGSNVSDYLRATTSNGERAVPLADTADATYPMFQVVTPDGVSLGVHDAATVSQFTPTVYEDWEDDTSVTDDWTVQSGSWSLITDADVLEGTQSAEAPANANATNDDLEATSLADTPARGDYFQVTMQFDNLVSGGQEVSFRWAYQDGNNHYQTNARLVDGSEKFRGFKILSGNATEVGVNSKSPPTGEPLTFHHRWTDDIWVFVTDSNGDPVGFIEYEETTLNTGSGYLRSSATGKEAQRTIMDEWRSEQAGKHILNWFDVATYEGTNPVVSASGNTDANNEQYVPAVIEHPNGTWYMYVKSDENTGSHRVRLWDSSDGVSWSVTNTDITATDSNISGSYTTSGTMLHDPGDSTTHLWYSVEDSNGETVGCAHRTGSDPTSMSDDADNPVVTPADLENAFFGGTVTQVNIKDVVIEGGTAYFFGEFFDSNGEGHIWYGTGDGNGFDTASISPQSELIGAARNGYLPGGTINSPCVFKEGGVYYMTFSQGDNNQTAGGKEMFCAVSDSLTGPYSFRGGHVADTEPGTWRLEWAYGGEFYKDNDGANLTLASDGNGDRRLYFNGQDDGSNGGGDYDGGAVGIRYFSSIPTAVI